MIDMLKNIFSNTTSEKKDSKSNELTVETALCVLLLETAHADGECSDEEKNQLVLTLTKQFNSDPASINELIENSYAQREEAVDIFKFTRHMNNTLSKEEKCEAMESVWRIILTDGQLEAHEDHFAHKLANLLRLSHTELIDCKIRAREQLSRTP